MLKQVKINENTIPLVLSTWKSIFPNEKLYLGFNGMDCFSYSLTPNNIGNHRYYLYYHGGEVVGMSGFYDEPDEQPKESSWLGWFGVLKPYRNQGFGSEIISYFEQEARDYGYSMCRMYTEDSKSNQAIQFYEKLGYTFEQYTRPVPPDCNVEKVLVGSKNLNGGPPVPWSNRPFYFD